MPMGLKLGMGLGAGLSPYTLPNGTEPLVLADFVNEVYRVGETDVAVTDMIASSEWNGEDWGIFNPADIINGTGYVPAETFAEIKLIGDALSTALTEGTVLVEFGNINFPGLPPTIDVHDPTFALEYMMGQRANDYALSDNMTTVLVLANPNHILPLGNHKLALNIRNGSMAASVNGADAVSGSFVAWSPAATEFFLTLGELTGKIGIYPAQDDADLPALSALS